MRVLIYGETKAAQERRGAEIAAGNTASLRNPGLFLASELEPCGLALADDPVIIAAYKARKIPTGPIMITQGGTGVRSRAKNANANQE